MSRMPCRVRMHDDRGYRSPSIVSLSSRARGVRFVGGKVKVHELQAREFDECPPLPTVRRGPSFHLPARGAAL